MSEPEGIGGRLRRLRLERGLSQREVSSPGVSYAYVSRIEAGTRTPSVKALRKLALKLGVTPEYLETGSDVRDTDLRELRLTEAELALRLSEEPEGARRELVEIMAEAESAGDAPVARRARIGLGLAEFELGHVPVSIQLLERAIDESELSPASRPDVYATLGRAYALSGRPGDAVELFDRCIEELEQQDEVGPRVRFTTYLSFALTDMGDLERAETVLHGVLDDVESFADPYTQVRIHWSLGRLAGAQGRLSESLTHQRRALALLEATEDTVHLARANVACAWSLIGGGRAEEAGDYLDAAATLFGAKPTPTDLAQLRTEQARRAAALGDAGEAVRFAREALDALGDSFPEEQGTALLALAEGLGMQGKIEPASDAFRRSVERFEEAGKAQESAQAYRAWGRMLRAAGRESEALDAFEKAADFAVAPPES